MNRREFLLTSSGAITAPIFSQRGFANAVVPHDEPRFPLPIVQGMTDENSTSILILHSQQLQVRVLGPNGEMPYSVHDSFAIPGNVYSLTELSIGGLVPTLNYELMVFDSKGRIFDQRSFSSLNVNRRSVRFASVSCMLDEHAAVGRRMWEALARENPDFVILNGDTVYCDFMDPARDEAGYGRRYIEARQALGWFYIPRLVPTLATWDDHDFGLNNADRTFPMAHVTRRLFRKFWGSRFNSACNQGLGVGSLFSAFGQRFFLMDDRSERNDWTNDFAAFAFFGFQHGAISFDSDFISRSGDGRAISWTLLYFLKRCWSLITT